MRVQRPNGRTVSASLAAQQNDFTGPLLATAPGLARPRMPRYVRAAASPDRRGKAARVAHCQPGACFKNFELLRLANTLNANPLHRTETCDPYAYLLLLLPQLPLTATYRATGRARQIRAECSSKSCRQKAR
jgi:hypothetical protein